MIADVEGGAAGYAFGSGMAAITAVMMLFKSGDHIVLTDDVYGGTYRVMTKVLNRIGIEATFSDTSSIEDIEKAIKPNTKAIYVETPTNKEEQAFVEGRITTLDNMIRNAKIIEDDGANSDIVSLGKTVTFTELPDGEEESYTIVGSAEADPFEGKISVFKSQRIYRACNRVFYVPLR